MKKALFLVGISFVLGACVDGKYLKTDNGGGASAVGDTETAKMMKEEGPGEDAMVKKVDEKSMMKAKEMVYQYSGSLADVTNGETIEGINTGAVASGVAWANFDEEGYMLLATFENLPDPKGTDFYEGWVVRKEPFDVISVGVVEKVDGKYTNVYSSGDDLTDHVFYVLTIEPDDGDPAPAGHIVEGTMEIVATL